MTPTATPSGGAGKACLVYVACVHLFDACIGDGLHALLLLRALAVFHACRLTPTLRAAVLSAATRVRPCSLRRGAARRRYVLEKGGFRTTLHDGVRLRRWRSRPTAPPYPLPCPASSKGGTPADSVVLSTRCHALAVKVVVGDQACVVFLTLALNPQPRLVLRQRW